MLAVLSACGEKFKSMSESKIEANGIVHGRAVRKGNALSRSVVALAASTDRGQALCTGSILDDQTILTAAHCVQHSENMLVIFAPLLDTADDSLVRRVDKVEMHPRWQKSESGDLALVHFSGGLPLGFEPVTFVQNLSTLAVGLEVRMLGYGVTNGLKRKGAGKIRETKSEIVSLTNGQEAITDGHSHSVCFGDSGGPAFVLEQGEWVQWGVAHAVSSEACDETSSHTVTLSFQRWITAAQHRLRNSL
jgi:secreted trypsin-like serine protease